ncbi:DUF6881 domain-containing protein [Nocardia sp. NPDC059180]|uniref:DUF6881 domain-containing protein n=1 Tax=Nocardia sp. NPDC059180 TaxID=3346761 RepID=UPI00368A5127
MSSSDTPKLVRQHELIAQIGHEIAGYAPSNWTKIDAIYMAAGNWLHRRLDIQTSTGPYGGSPGPINAAPIRELRDVMFTPGAGTWFTMYLTITSDGNVSTNFDYDNRPPRKAPIGLALKEDLEKYPRLTIPQWIHDDLAESVHSISKDGHLASSDHDHQSVTSTVASSSDAITEPRPTTSAVSDITSQDEEFRYIRIDRSDDSTTGPVTIFSEIDEDGYENRRVEVFRDGSSDFAGGLMEGETTILNDEPIPTVSEISQRPGVTAIEITLEDFQRAWIAADGFED